MNQSELIQDTLAEIGVSGRVSHRPPFYRLTLSGKGRGRLIVELPDMGTGEPSIATFTKHIFTPRPPKWMHETEFFTESELSAIRRLL